MPDYTLGRALPAPHPAPGAAAWCSAPPTSRLVLYRRALEAALDAEVLTLAPGPQTMGQRRRPPDPAGLDLPVDFGALMARCTQLARQHADELAAARAFAQTLPPGMHDIRAARAAQAGFRQSQDAHQRPALGSGCCWGQGSVAIHADHNGLRHYTLDFRFHFQERYHAAGSQPAGIAGGAATEASTSPFHRPRPVPAQALHGLLRQRLRWIEGQTAVEVLRRP